MKLSTFCLFAALIMGCGATLNDPWTHAGSGSCYDVQVNLRSTDAPVCPHRGHFPPMESGRSSDGKFVGYVCACQR